MSECKCKYLSPDFSKNGHTTLQLQGKIELKKSMKVFNHVEHATPNYCLVISSQSVPKPIAAGTAFNDLVTFKVSQ